MAVAAEAGIMGMVGTIGHWTMILGPVTGALITSWTGAKNVCKQREQANQGQDAVATYKEQWEKVLQNLATLQTEAYQDLRDSFKAIQDNREMFTKMHQKHVITRTFLEVFLGCVFISMFLILLLKYEKAPTMNIR